MASATRKLKLIRKRKLSRMGKKRKTANRENGTTKSKAELFGDNK